MRWADAPDADLPNWYATCSSVGMSLGAWVCDENLGSSAHGPCMPRVHRAAVHRPLGTVMPFLTAGAPFARSAMAYVLAGGKGSRLLELTDWRAKPAVYFGGKSRIVDFALSNALNSGIRRIGVATQYKAHSLIRHLQRGWNFFRLERNESFDILPASQRVTDEAWYAGHGRRGLPEHRHHRELRAQIHRHPGRRSHLQDGLRADAGAARRAERRRDGRMPGSRP